MPTPTTLTPLHRLPLNPGETEGPFQTFFVPKFEIKVSGKQLQPEVIHDVLQVTYRDNLTDVDSFEFTVSNYESGRAELSTPLRSRYEPPSREEFRGIFDPGETIELKMGYVNDLRLMLKGTITTLEPSFNQSGGLSLTVRGLNELHKFRSVQHTDSWQGKKDSDIAKEIGDKPLSKKAPGLGFTVRVNEEARWKEQPDSFVFMNNQYDIVFLMERARRRDYVVVLNESDEKGNPYIYFGPSNDRATPTTYELEWGKTLVSFRPTLTTARQVAKVTVVGWDRRRNQPIKGSASWSDLLPKQNTTERRFQESLLKAFGNREEIISDQPVRDNDEAKSRAKSILRNMKKDMVEATGETVGLPDLRAGRKVQISSLGDRFSGLYYVTQTTHTINDSGYRTTFEARREEDVEG